MHSEDILEGGVGVDIHAVILVTVFTINFCECYCL